MQENWSHFKLWTLFLWLLNLNCLCQSLAILHTHNWDIKPCFNHKLVLLQVKMIFCFNSTTVKLGYNKLGYNELLVTTNIFFDIFQSKIHVYCIIQLGYNKFRLKQSNLVGPKHVRYNRVSLYILTMLMNSFLLALLCRFKITVNFSIDFFSHSLLCKICWLQNFNKFNFFH